MKIRRWVLIALVALLCACRGSGNGQPSFNLEPLRPFLGVSDWSMARGGPTNSGYVPVTLDASHFSARWSVNLPKGNTDLCNNDEVFSCVYIFPAVTDSADGRVIVTTDETTQTANVDSNDVTLLSLHEQDGSTAWSQTGFPLSDDNLDSDWWSDASIAGGRVYMTIHVDSQVFPRLPELDAFDAKTGAKLFSVNPPCASPCSENAYFVTNSVIAGSILYAGKPMSAFDAGDGTLLWTVPSGAFPAVDARAAYVSGAVASASSPAFTALNPASGSTLFQILPSAAEAMAGLIGGSPPALDGMDGAVVQRTKFLDRYSLSTHALDWETAGVFGWLPVVGRSAVYVCAGTAVAAYDIGSGAKLWSWTPPDDDTLKFDATNDTNCSLVITDNVLFVSSHKATYAVDLTSHATEWSWPEGGKLSVSPSGLLYISVNDPKPAHLVAINLH